MDSYQSIIQSRSDKESSVPAAEPMILAQISVPSKSYTGPTLANHAHLGKAGLVKPHLKNCDISESDVIMPNVCICRMPVVVDMEARWRASTHRHFKRLDLKQHLLSWCRTEGRLFSVGSLAPLEQRRRYRVGLLTRQEGTHDRFAITLAH